MKIQRMGSMIASLALTASLAGAQATTATPPQSGVQRITFAEAVDLALRQNLAVRQAENTVELQAIGTRQTGLQRIPNLNFSMGGSNFYGRVFDPTTGNITNDNTQSATAGVSSNFTLFDFNATGNRVRSQRFVTDAAEAQLERTRQDAVYLVATGFVAYVSALGRLDVQKENLSSLELQEQQIQRFADAGARPISDLYQQRANVANARLNVAQAELAVETAKFGLMQTLQLDPARDYDFVAPAIPETLAQRSYNLDSLVRIAYTRRTDIRAAEFRVESSRRQIAASNASRLPSFGVNAGYNSSARWSSGQKTPWTDQFDQNRGGSFGLNLNVPFWDRGQISLNKRNAEVQLENNQLALSNQRQTVALDIRRAWFNVRSAQQQLAAAQAGLVAATQALEATTQRYNVGAATLLDVTQARALRVQAASSLNDARFTLVLNQAALDYWTGELDPKSMALIR